MGRHASRFACIAGYLFPSAQYSFSECPSSALLLFSMRAVWFIELSCYNKVCFSKKAVNIVLESGIKHKWWGRTWVAVSIFRIQMFQNSKTQWKLSIFRTRRVLWKHPWGIQPKRAYSPLWKKPDWSHQGPFPMPRAIMWEKTDTWRQWVCQRQSIG